MKGPRPYWPPSVEELRKVHRDPLAGADLGEIEALMYDDLFDRYGEPITYRDWHFLRMFPAYKRVAADELVLDDIVYVSTVWLGMDHGFRPYTTKLIFETMVFGGEFDQEMWRYTTEEEALDGHAQVVKALSTPPENRQVQ